MATDGLLTVGADGKPIARLLLSQSKALASNNVLSRSDLGCNTMITRYPRPIPSGTAVPAWAYHNVTDIDAWNASIAEDIANLQIPDSTALPAPTDSSAPALSDFSTASLTTSSPTSAGSASNPAQSTMTVGATSSKDVGTIVGGVLGGTALLAIIALAVVMRTKYSRMSKQPASITYSAGNQPYTSSNWTLDTREKLSPLDSLVPASVQPRAYVSLRFVVIL